MSYHQEKASSNSLHAHSAVIYEHLSQTSTNSVRLDEDFQTLVNFAQVPRLRGGAPKRQPSTAVPARRSSRLLNQQKAIARTTLLRLDQFNEHWQNKTWLVALPKFTPLPHRVRGTCIRANFLMREDGFMCSDIVDLWAKRRICINPTIRYINPTIFGNASIYDRIIEHFDDQAVQKIILPVCLNFLWILLTITRNEAFHYDPTHQPPSPPVKEFLDNLGFTVHEWNGATVPQQQDGTSCGQHICLMMMSVITQQPWIVAQADQEVPAFRERFREELEQDLEILPESALKHSYKSNVPQPKRKVSFRGVPSAPRPIPTLSSPPVKKKKLMIKKKRPSSASKDQTVDMDSGNDSDGANDNSATAPQPVHPPNPTPSTPPVKKKKKKLMKQKKRPTRTDESGADVETRQDSPPQHDSASEDETVGVETGNDSDDDSSATTPQPVHPVPLPPQDKHGSIKFMLLGHVETNKKLQRRGISNALNQLGVHGVHQQEIVPRASMSGKSTAFVTRSRKVEERILKLLPTLQPRSISHGGWLQLSVARSQTIGFVQEFVFHVYQVLQQSRRARIFKKNQWAEGNFTPGHLAELVRAIGKSDASDAFSRLPRRGKRAVLRFAARAQTDASWFRNDDE